MKNSNLNIQAIISFIVCFISFSSLFGQMPTPPTPPPPPVIAEASSSTHNVKIRVNGEYGHSGDFEGTTKVSTNQNYRYTSVFEKDLTSKIESVLINELGEPATVSKNIKKWNGIDGKKINDLQVILKDGKVKIIYKDGNEKVMKRLNKLTKAICKITYQSNCD